MPLFVRRPAALGRSRDAGTARASGSGPDRTTRSRRTLRRLKILSRQTPLLLLASLFVVTGVVAGVFYFNDRPTVLRIAVGPPGSEDARLVHAIAQQFGRDRNAAVRLAPIVKEGPGAAARALQNREVDLAVVRRDVGFPAVAQAVAVLHDNVAVLMVPAEGSLAVGGPKPAESPAAASSRRKRGGKTSAAKAAAKPAAPESPKIDSIEGLAGHRIGLVGPGMGDREILESILRQYQVPVDKVTVVPLDARDVASALRAHPVDAVLALGPVASPHVAGAVAAASNGRTGPTFLEIGASEVIAARMPVYEEAELKAGVFGGQTPQPPDAVETIGFKHYIVARRSVPEDTVADLTRQIFTARQTLSSEFPMAARIEKPDTDRDAAVPAHPGAAAYIDDDQKSFFDRYSDFIYIGAMALSGVGSGLAWLASQLRADTRSRRRRLLERLIGLIDKAHAADDLAALVTLDQEIDEIVALVLLPGGRDGVDQGSLAGYTLAFDQARAAVAARRAQLAVAASVGDTRATETPAAAEPAPPADAAPADPAPGPSATILRMTKPGEGA